MESVKLKQPPNPCESANFLSKIFFLWLLPLFGMGYKKEIKFNDIYEPLMCDKSRSLGDRLEKNWKIEKMKEKKGSLLAAILSTFWKEYLLMSLLNFSSEIILCLGQPILLNYLLKYFRKGTKTTYQDALMYAIGMVALNALNSIIVNHYQHLAFHNALKTRVAVCSLVYRKTLRLSQTALGQTSSGNMINLLSNDVSRFEWALYLGNYIWIAPLLTSIAACLLWLENGFAGLIGIAVIFIIMPILSGTLKFTARYRLKTALKTDERIRLMNEIISGVQVIKMYAWEKPFAKLIAYTRRMELKSIRITSNARGLQMIFLLFTPRVVLFGTMVGIVFLCGSEHITAARIFAISSILTAVSTIMTQHFARSIGETSEVRISFGRLEKFLSLDEKVMDRYSSGKQDQQNEIAMEDAAEKNSVCVSMKNVLARWATATDEICNHPVSINGKSNGFVETDQPKQPLTLDNLNIDFLRGKLIGVIGPVGSGKSSLLQALLRELPLESGSIAIDGVLSYASQEPWIFAASIRQNILFGQEYDHERYNKVVKCCALTKDFEQLENGDLTLIGERGSSISGGQKARINLARACYREADIYLLDDPLSAVDAHVGTHIFGQCIGPKGYLSKQRSTRILVTHQVHFLKEADWLIVLRDGKVEIQGAPNDLYKSNVAFVELVGIIETELKENAVELRRSSSAKSLGSMLPRTSCTSLESTHLSEIYLEDEGVQMEASSKGTVKGSMLANYFTAGVSWSILVAILFSCVFAQIIASTFDYCISIWTAQEEMRFSTEQEKSSFTLSTNTCVYMQSSLISLLLIVAMARTFGFYSICMRISQHIHDIMFKGIISSNMRFFDTNPSGRILNRFSKDLGAIDEILPKIILDATQVVLSAFGSISVAMVVNPFLLLPVSLLSILAILFRKIYLKTSKHIKRQEGIAKSPVFTHLGATLNGLPTIRAYNKEEILLEEFDHFQDIHSGSWFMSITSVSVFGLYVDALCSIFMACIVFYYMLFETDAPAVKIGLAISQALSLTGNLPWGVRETAEINNQMVAVERSLEYRELEPEKQPLQPMAVTKEWPSKGAIEFRNVFYRYSSEAEPVLRGLSFVIEPMEKIGVVGRTGAGKSSLIGSLFRLACIDGEILIDGIDTAEIQLDDLRKRIAIIPQDPILFSGTLRRNLDPFEEYSDDDIWSALESVELKSAISDSFGLQSIVLAHGANYSVGQRQLLCLARAILRKNRILVLDEATANVDPQTDALIQQTIRTKFIHCTVVTVAHRLHTIIDSDRVIVMDAGTICEFEEPHNLLQNKNGIFYGMVKALGEHEFNHLALVASDNYISSTNL